MARGWVGCLSSPQPLTALLPPACLEDVTKGVSVSASQEAAPSKEARGREPVSSLRMEVVYSSICISVLLGTESPLFLFERSFAGRSSFIVALWFCVKSFPEVTAIAIAIAIADVLPSEIVLVSFPSAP